MELIYQHNDGLGLSFKKLGRTIKRNVNIKQISLKNVVKIAPVVTSFIPGIGPLASAGIKAATGMLSGGGIKSVMAAGLDYAGSGAGSALIKNIGSSGVGKFAQTVVNSGAGKVIDKAAHTQIGKFVVDQGGKIVNPVVSQIKTQIKAQGGTATPEQVQNLQAISESVQAKIENNPEGAGKQKVLENLHKASSVPDNAPAVIPAPTPAQISAITQAKTTGEEGSKSVILPLLIGSVALGGLYLALK